MRSARRIGRGGRSARKLTLLASIVAVGVTTSGCIGAVVGTVVDQVTTTVRIPIHEYLFLGAYKYDNDDKSGWRDLDGGRPREIGNELVGVAVSGGGSRSAYFLACVLDEMRQIRVEGSAEPTTLLDEVDYLSSVSGGSLASAYYTLLRPATSDERVLDQFFQRYRTDMRKHFELRSLGRMFLLFRWAPLMATYYHRGHLMASTWDAGFFDDATFSDLPPPEPPHPSLIVNATSYLTGQKFLYTRLPLDQFNNADLFKRVREGRLLTEGYDQAHRPLENAGFQTIDSDIGPYKISYAVGASSGVPNLMGPFVVVDRTQENRLDALGDGGLYDNYGLETLVQLFSGLLEKRPGLKARIIIVDGSGYFSAERDVLDMTLADYSDLTATISWLRAAGYAESFFRSVPGERTLDGSDAGKAGPYRNLRFQVVSLYHTPDLPAEPRGILGRVRRAVRGVVRPLFKPVVGIVGDVNEEVRGIGTRFRLRPADAEAIEHKARVVVADVLGRSETDMLGGGDR